MKTMFTTIALLALTVSVASAEDPFKVPSLMTAQVTGEKPRMELRVCENSMLTDEDDHGLPVLMNAGEIRSVEFGQRFSFRPDAPEGQKQVMSYVMALTIRFAPAYLKDRGDKPLLLSTGSSLTQAYDQVTPMAKTSADEPGTLKAKKHPCQAGVSVREFTVKDGQVRLLTEADFTHGVIWDPGTGKAVYELVRKGG